MIQKIVDGICQTLSREFTEQEYEIYTESVEQGLKVPCFSVLMLKASIERQSEHRYQKTYPVRRTLCRMPGNFGAVIQNHGADRDGDR